jgi:superfamily II DNA/RNA helicase
VLDEVDRMLDIGFRDDIRNILSRIKGIRRDLERNERRDDRRDESRDTEREPGGGAGGDGQGEDHAEGAPAPEQTSPQTIFVSATIAGEIEKLARQYMKEPVEKLVAPGSDEKPTVEEVEQYYFSVQPWDKYRLLRTLLVRENPDLAIVFTKTKHGAQKLAKKLYADGIECREIHGNLVQTKRERVMKSFRSGKFDVLVATDLASRGIDVADISHIINYDIPEDPEVYVHRVGRTARMGKGGKAFTFVQRDQGDELTKVENLINMVVPLATIEGFEPSPPPSDWTDAKPQFGAPDQPPKPVVSRFERPFASHTGAAAGAPAPAGAGAGAAASPVALPPPRTIGSKIPINRRHKRRR